jgi:hypothetical protein
MQALGTNRQFVTANEVFLTSHESCSLGPLQAACRSDVTSGPNIISGANIGTLLLRGRRGGRAATGLGLQLQTSERSTYR